MQGAYSFILVFFIAIPEILCSNSTGSCKLQFNCARTWFVDDDFDSDCKPGADILYKVRYDIVIDSIVLVGSNCMTYDQESSISYVGYCPSNNLELISTFETVVPRNSSELDLELCGRLNRTGFLCKDCQDGLGPAIFSLFSKCVKCSERFGWVLFILHALVPTTIFLFVILIFRIDALSPKLNAFILWCQLVANMLFLNPAFFASFYEHNRYTYGIFVDVISLIGSVIVGFWNLDFFRYVFPAYCISHRTNLLQVVALEYVVALYPLCFTALIYYAIQWHDNDCKLLVWMWRPMHRLLYRFRKKLHFKESVLSSFVTFLILSFSKLLTISVTLLRVTPVYNNCGERLESLRVYLNPNLIAFSSDHLLYAIPAIAIILFANVLPVLYVSLYTIGRIRSTLDRIVKSILWKELAKSSQRSFKDGLDGSLDCRSFASLYLIARCVFVVILMERVGSLYLALLMLTFGLAVLGFKPYKENRHNIIDFFILVSYAASSFIFFLVQVSFVDSKAFVSFLVVLILPLLYGIAVLFLSVGKMIKLYALVLKLSEQLRHYFKNRSSFNPDSSLESPDGLVNSNNYDLLASV